MKQVVLKAGFKAARAVAFAATAASAAIATPASPQPYPSRPVTLVQGFGVGGNADTVARLLAAEMQQGLGQPVVVEAAGREHEAVYARAFTDVAEGEMLLYEDAYRTLALAVNRGSASDVLGVVLDAELRVLPR